MKIINIGILAHVDAGKTTLTESLLYTSGAVPELGSVDKGTTRTDTMLLERQRGITIQTAVTSFGWKNYKINIVDLKNAELSTEQNCNMIDGIPNNTPLPPAPPEPDRKPLDKVKEPPSRKRSREREDR